jgi:restriction endonuclease S subunit
MSAIAKNNRSKLRRVVELTVRRGEDNSLPYVGLENVESRTGRYLEGINEMPDAVANEFVPGDVLFGKLRPYLAKSLAPDFHGRCSGELLVLRPKEVDAKFLHYWLLSEETISAVSASTYGAKMPRADWDFIGNLEIPTPPIPTHRRIAAYLDRETRQIDSLMASKEELLLLLEEKRASLISHAVTRGLNPKAKLKPSGIPWLGDVPEHWEAKRLRFLLAGSLKYGANESAILDDPDLPRFIRITDLNPDGSLRFDTFKSLPQNDAAPYLLSDGDILFARTGATVGKALLYRAEMGPACYAGYLIRARLKRHIMDPEFLFLFTQSGPYWEQIRLGTIQATIQNYSADKYGDMQIPVPPPSEQLTIAVYVGKCLQDIARVQQEILTSITLLRERRSSLISAAVTGEMNFL